MCVTHNTWDEGTEHKSSRCHLSADTPETTTTTTCVHVQQWAYVQSGGVLRSVCACLPQGQLYLLVTDQGFLTEEKVVWESLHNVDGDGNFCDSEFRLRPPSDPETVYRGQQDQIDQVGAHKLAKNELGVKWLVPT